MPETDVQNLRQWLDELSKEMSALRLSFVDRMARLEEQVKASVQIQHVPPCVEIERIKDELKRLREDFSAHLKQHEESDKENRARIWAFVMAMIGATGFGAAALRAIQAFMK